MQMKRAFIGICCVALSLAAKAQVDPHFTQYYVHTSWLNPALTGVFDGDYRVAGIYRNQWGNVSSPFSTAGASAEFQTSKNINLGVNAVNQKSADGGFTYTTAYGNFNYTGVRFGEGEYQRVAMAIQMGIIQRKFNPSKLVFSDQWNAATGTINPTMESFSKTSSLQFDAGAGLLYYDATPGKKANLFAGFEFTANSTEKTNLRYTAHAGVRISISEDFRITPNALFLQQGNAQEKMLGMYAQLRAAANTDVLLGVNYRVKDAMAVHAGFTYNNLVLSVSYDVNTSELGKAARGTNSFEVSISYTGRKKAHTPEVEFVCPRL
jgi:type IX secretion system PorP/SprF family membrane protein